MKERTLGFPQYMRAMSDGTPKYNIIVKPHLLYDGGGVPVDGHGKVASPTENVRGSCDLYIPHEHIH